jgi:hypothetical protein
MPAAALSLRCADWRRYDAPRFTAVSPTSGKTAADTRVSVTGRAFTGVRAVKFASGVRHLDPGAVEHEAARDRARPRG